MTFRLEKLKIFCKESEEVVEFGTRFSFFYGEMGVGKSSIANLVYYCFGGNVSFTPALTSEFIKAQLSVVLGRYSVVLERSIEGHSYVDAYWVESDGVAHAVSLPVNARHQPVYGKDVYCLSDFLLLAIGLPVIRVRESKNNPEARMVRLSFLDFFRFNYLDQLELDSSFFRLDQPVVMEKSKDALRYLLGLQSDRLFDLQAQLSAARNEMRELRASANALDEFLTRYDLNSVDAIQERLARLNEQEDRLNSTLQAGAVEVSARTTVSEELHARKRRLEEEIREKNQALTDINQRVEDQRELRGYLINYKMSAARSAGASELLGRVKFEFCPACGSQVHHNVEEDQCYLCKTPRGDVKGELESSVVDEDLSERIKDLDYSIKRLQEGRRKQEQALEALYRERREVFEEERRYLSSVESEYITRIREFESERAKTRERIENLRDLLPMPEEVQRKHRSADEKAGLIEEIKREIENEQSRFQRGFENVRALEGNFLQILLKVKFPGISEADKIKVNTRNWYPYVCPNGSEDMAWTFRDAGSGGKTVLFKTCFALAFHKTCAEKNLGVPQILIVDSTMKNIAPEVHPEVFNAFYETLFELVRGSLASWQLVLIDQTLYELPADIEGVVVRRLSKDDPENPALIGYYFGH